MKKTKSRYQCLSTLFIGMGYYVHDSRGTNREVLKQAGKNLKGLFITWVVKKKYQAEVLNKARENHMSEEDIAYIEEDLRSPCTQEI